MKCSLHKQILSNPNWHKSYHNSPTKFTTNQIKLNSHHKLSTTTQLNQTKIKSSLNPILTQIKISTLIIYQKEKENKPTKIKNLPIKRIPKASTPSSSSLLPLFSSSHSQLALEISTQKSLQLPLSLTINKYQLISN